MASDFEISVAAQNAACDAIVDLIDGGAAAGTLAIRTGVPPATCAAVDTGVLLGTLTFSDPAFGAAAAGVATVTPSITSDSSADASGDAGHFRVKDSNGVVIMQGTAGEAADAPVDMQFDEKTIVAGGVIACTSFTVTVPLQ